jgi:hypothetical protein
MNGAANQEVQKFLAQVRVRIAHELALSQSPGIRHTVRAAAAARAADLLSDLDYLRASYTSERVMVGQGSAR